MTHAEARIRTGGGWLAAASALLAVTFVAHGPIPLGEEGMMTHVAGEVARWSAVHWMAALALSLFVVAGLILLTARSRLTERPLGLSAWAVLPVGGLWTVSTAVAELSAAAQSAVAGDEARFAAWMSFAEAHANGFAAMALAVAAIAWTELRVARPLTPRWAAGVGAVAGVASFAGWVLGSWLAVPGATMLWVAGAVVMCLWTLWLGVALLRVPAQAAATGSA